MAEMSNIEAMKLFFERGGGRQLSMAELKALSSDERAELGKLCREALAKLLTENKPNV